MSLPRFTISWNKNDPELSISVKDGVFPNGRGVVIGFDGYKPEPILSNSETRSALVIGNPIIGDRIAISEVAERVLEEVDLTSFARSLNGQFLIIILEKTSRSVTILNDRFNGVPFYFANFQDQLLGAHLYFDLFKVVRRRPGVGLRADAMFEFLWLSRVLMDSTYDTASIFLLPASVLQVSREKVNNNRYWRPNFEKDTSSSAAELGEQYVYLLKQSLKRLTSDRTEKRYGHFLSGGHDSRSILAAFPEPPVCLTVAFADNYEVSCARESARAVGARHRFIRLPKDHMVRNFDDAIRLCGGMYAFLDALFLGISREVQEEADVLFHGHGLDYMFQGMYLPSRWRYLFGRPTFYRELLPVRENIVDQYLTTVPFRVKGIDIQTLLDSHKKNSVMQGLRGAVQRVVDDGADVCRNLNDSWEYLIMHALGRHYSHPNISSKHSAAEQRTPSFDNDLFDFYLSLPERHRLSGNMMRFALNSMNKKLGRIRTGNWGLPAGASAHEKTAWLITRKVVRHITGRKNLSAPSAVDRTWPDRETYMSQSSEFRQHARSALRSEQIRDTLTDFDWVKLDALGECWLSGEPGGASFLMALTTLHRFLSLKS